jgi:hypothetical protein
VIDVVCWKWKPVNGYRSRFPPSAVNVLRRMVARHLRLPHRFTCVTDDAHGIDPEVRVLPLWDIYADVPNPSSPRNPSCYRRLRMFSAEARELIGERILSLDLDVVITGDLTPLVDRPDDFVIWGGQTVQPGSMRPYNWCNGSLIYLRAGTRQQVWNDFDPRSSPRIAHAAGCRGSDQGWIAYKLGRKEATWGTADGVFSYRNHVMPAGGRLPGGARVVVFHGQYDPWERDVQRRHAWVREHYR